MLEFGYFRPKEAGCSALLAGGFCGAVGCGQGGEGLYVEGAFCAGGSELKVLLCCAVDAAIKIAKRVNVEHDNFAVWVVLLQDTFGD